MRPTLILGAGGMLGFALVHWFAGQGREVAATIRQRPLGLALPQGVTLFTGVAADDFDTVAEAISRVRPEVVVNCIGIRSANGCPGLLRMYRINGTFPRKLSTYCERNGVRLIHISSDGVFDGSHGGLVETDPTTAANAYGRSKAWGERLVGPALILRTSMIGLSPERKGTLLDWLMNQAEGVVQGYSRVVFSGPTVVEIARFLHTCILDADRAPTGIVHLAAAPIDKCRLLELTCRALGGDPDQIVANPEPVSDRSLLSVRKDIYRGYATPSWPTMIAELRSFYEQLGMDWRLARL